MPFDSNEWTALPAGVLVTEFPNQAPTTLTESRVTLAGLAARIRSASAPSKAELPWLKLARFNGEPNPATSSGCVRYNAGVVAVSGIEADYDGETVPMSDAAEKLRRAGVEALLYTSASHTPAKPRWRVLCPFATEHSPAERTRFLDQLNGVLGGILTPESWTLSQSYYFGNVDGKPPVEVDIVPGARFDLCIGLDAGAIGKGKKERGTRTDTHEGRDAPEGLVESDDNFALHNAAQARIKRFLKTYEGSRSPTGTGAYVIVNLLFDMRFRDKILSDAAVIHELAEADWPIDEQTLDNAKQYRQNKARGCDDVSGERIGPGEYLGEEEEAETPISDKAAIYKLLAVEHWLERDIKPMDWLLSEVMATTTRSLVYAPTGLGKTNIGLALSAHLAAGKDFLHWRTHRACRVLYLDGEMPDILLKGRLRDAVRRLGSIPKGNLLALNRGDFPDMQPLNTVKIDPESGKKSMPGVAFVEQLLEMFGPFDVVVFDNIQALLSGSMSETDQWQAVLPWVLELSRRRIAQIWFHHTGLSGDHMYGDSSRAWQLDNVMAMTPAETPGVDISFYLKFEKARNRTPDNRADFEAVRVTLAEDRWECQRLEAVAAATKAAMRMTKIQKAVVAAVYATRGYAPMEFTNATDWPNELQPAEGWFNCGTIQRRNGGIYKLSDAVKQAIDHMVGENVPRPDIYAALEAAVADGELTYRSMDKNSRDAAGYDVV
jgi:hypothetical protein